MRIKCIIGYIGLKCSNILPANGAYPNLGQRRFRAIFAKMYMKSCGANVNIQRNSVFSHRCSIGDNSGIGENSELYGPVEIGNDVMMGKRCVIYTRNHEFESLDKPMWKQGPQPEKKVIIGNNVWIGGDVIILPGVHIHDGVVIGAGSVVTKDAPENGIIAGNPAKLIRYRGEPKQ